MEVIVVLVMLRSSFIYYHQYLMCSHVDHSCLVHAVCLVDFQQLTQDAHAHIAYCIIVGSIPLHIV